MKKLILITILTPIISFSQTYYDGALNFQNKFEGKLEISRRQNLKGPGDINNLQLQDVQGIHYLIPKVV